MLGDIHNEEQCLAWRRAPKAQTDPSTGSVLTCSMGHGEGRCDCQAPSPEPCSGAALSPSPGLTQMVQSHHNYPPPALHLSLCLVFYPSFKLAVVSRTKIQFKSYFWSIFVLKLSFISQRGCHGAPVAPVCPGVLTSCSGCVPQPSCPALQALLMGCPGPAVCAWGGCSVPPHLCASQCSQLCA